MILKNMRVFKHLKKKPVKFLSLKLVIILLVTDLST